MWTLGFQSDKMALKNLHLLPQNPLKYSLNLPTHPSLYPEENYI